MGSMPTTWYKRRRELAFALMRAGVVSAGRNLDSPLFRINTNTPPLTETLAVEIAQCMHQMITASGIEYDAIASLYPGLLFARVLARISGKNGRRCIHLKKEGQAISADGLIRIDVQRILIVSDCTVLAEPEYEAARFLNDIGFKSPGIAALSDYGIPRARRDLDEWGCSLYPVFSATELRDMHAAWRESNARAA